MTLSLIAVASVNSLITRNDESGTGFASKADETWFRQKLRESDLVLMGGATYRAARNTVRENARIGPPRWVFTRHRERCAGEGIPGCLEFRGLDRDTLIADIEKNGYEAIALVGGPALSGWFVDHGLVDDLYLTLEPYLFSSGTPLVTLATNTDLNLQSVSQLSEQTLLLHYRLETG
jgi:dihydrofolate reductase